MPRAAPPLQEPTRPPRYGEPVTATLPPNLPSGASTPGAVLQLVRTGTAVSRRRIAQFTGLAPSTAAARVGALLEAGYLQEDLETRDHRGRAPRTLSVDPNFGDVASIVVHEGGFDIAVADAAGDLRANATERVDIKLGPEHTLRHAAEQLAKLRKAAPAQLLAVTLGLPAPIDRKRASTATATQLAGWENTNLQDVWSTISGSRLLLENDANLLAIAAREQPAPRASILAVKLDERIGSGIIIGGVLYSGARGAAGEMSHSAVDADPVIGCACGIEACLESVASGAALIVSAQHQGITVETLDDLLRLAKANDPAVIDLFRSAAHHIGALVAELTNFLNPDEVVFGGVLAGIPAFTAALRGEIHRLCLPIISQELVTRSATLEFAEAIGGIRLALDDIFSPRNVDLDLR